MCARKSSQSLLFPVPTLTLALALGLALTACQGTQEPSPSAIYGPMTATGMIASTGASLYRRGTHVLQMDGATRFFLESRMVDLNRFEGQTAAVRGELALNTHPSFLPVIVVMEVTPLSRADDLKELQRYDVPTLHLSLDAPRDWQGSLEEGMLLFRLEKSDDPFLAISIHTDPLPAEGIPLRIGGRNGLRVMEEERSQHRVYSELAEGSSILFLFTPNIAHPELRDAFYALLHTVRFTGNHEDSPDASGASSSSSMSDPFIPCGGPAHVLCPSGMYCEIREMDTGIGACKMVR